MARQVLVIGLGQFGMAIARSLSENGAEVIVVDTNEQHIKEAAAHVADAILMDAMDQDALLSLAPDKRDTCVCAIGDENREASIVVTALLRQCGAPHIVSRATDDLHARILNLVGAHEVIHPERSFGEGMAARLAWPGVKGAVPVGEGLVFVTLDVSGPRLGRTLAELKLQERFGVRVAAVIQQGVFQAVLDEQAVLTEHDSLLLVGPQQALKRMLAVR